MNENTRDWATQDIAVSLGVLVITDIKKPSKLRWNAFIIVYLFTKFVGK